MDDKEEDRLWRRCILKARIENLNLPRAEREADLNEFMTLCDTIKTSGNLINIFDEVPNG
jgi:hypothetical protein